MKESMQPSLWLSKLGGDKPAYVELQKISEDQSPPRPNTHRHAWPKCIQGRHGEFEPGKAQYSTPIFFDQLFLIRVLKPKI